MLLRETLNGKNGRAARAFPAFSLMSGPWYPALRDFCEEWDATLSAARF